jgi:superfamily II DNA or RNA helicase
MEQLFRFYEKQMCLYHEQETGQLTWHWSKIPDDVLVKSGWRYNLNKLRATRIQRKLQNEPMEYGLDGVSFDGTTYHGLQAKCWKEQSSICAYDLGTFLSVMMNRLCVKNKNSQGFLYTMARLERHLEEDMKNGNIVQTIRLEYPQQQDLQLENVQDEIFTPKPLRDYQKEAVECLLEYKKIGVENGWLNMCCGTGKTLIYSEFARSFQKIIVISPLRVSAEQNLKRISEWLDLDDEQTLLVDCDGVRDDVLVKKFWKNKNKILVSSTFKSADDVIQLALFGKKGRLDENVLIVVDEAHNRSEEMREWLTNKKRNAFLLWVSATPIPHDDEPVLFKYSWADALKNNWICDYEIFLPILEKNEEVGSDNVEELLLLKARFLLIGMMRTGSSHVIVYCHSKNECDEFSVLFQKLCEVEMGLLENDLWISKITDEVPSKRRSDILKEFQNNQARLSILTSVRILDEAIDIPRCDGIYLLRVSKNKESWVRTVQRMSRSNRLDPDNPHKKSSIFLWLDQSEQENLPKCLEMIRHNDPEFFKKMRCLDVSSYEKDESPEELDRVEQNETIHTRCKYCVKCVSLEELKELKLNMIIEYYNKNGEWVKFKYEENGYKLGSFWLSIRNGHTRINDEQRKKCLDLDPDCFKMRIFNKVALGMKPEDKIEECIQYWKNSGMKEWPPSKFKTLWNIGAFWHSIRNGSVKLSEEQQQKLLKLDPNCLTINKVNSITNTLKTPEKIDILIEYIKNNGIPNVDYVRADGLRIGRLLHSIKINHIGITDEQRKKLLEAHPDCLNRREINEDAKKLTRIEKLKLVKEYIKENKTLPLHKYITDTGFALGVFVKCVKYGSFEITDAEREELAQLYPKFFEIRKITDDAKNLSMDEKLEILKEYIKQHNNIPKSRFKTDSGFALGAFVGSVKYRNIKLSDKQYNELKYIQIFLVSFDRLIKNISLS